MTKLCLRLLPLCLGLCLGLTSSATQAQGCCGIGSSLVAGGHPTLDKGSLLLQSGTDYSNADSPHRFRMAAMLGIGYGITERLALSLKTNYAWLRSSVHQPAVVYGGAEIFPATTKVFSNNGFGDGSVAVQFSVLPLTALTKQELKAGLDLGIPWGPDRKRKAGAELPPNSQTGSGALTMGGFLSYNKSFPAHRIAGAATAAGRLRFKSRRGDVPGNEAGLVASVIGGPFWIAKASLSLSYKAIEATEDASGFVLISSGGNRLDLMPGVELDFSERVKATCDADIPAWRDQYQNVYGNKFALRATILFFVPILASGQG